MSFTDPIMPDWSIMVAKYKPFGQGLGVDRYLACAADLLTDHLFAGYVIDDKRPVIRLC